MVMMAHLRPADAGEEGFGAVRIDAGLGAVELAVVNPGDLVLGVQVIPGPRLVSHDGRPGTDTGPDPGVRGGFGAEHGWQVAATAFPDDHNHLALAVLVLRQPAIPAFLFVVRGLHVTTRIQAIDLYGPAFAANRHALGFGRHRFPDIMGQDESRLVLAVQITGERQSGLTLDLIAEDRDGREI